MERRRVGSNTRKFSLPATAYDEVYHNCLSGLARMTGNDGLSSTTCPPYRLFSAGRFTGRWDVTSFRKGNCIIER
jgi:hypothetical protein